MRDSGGDGETPGAEIDRLARVAKSMTVRDGRPDLSPAAVNQRLSAFVSEHKAALAKGDPRALRESDRLLCAMAEDAFEAQARADLAQPEAQRRLAEVEANGWRMRGGRMQ
jgi:uncharacterized protein (DUF2252 family)